MPLQMQIFHSSSAVSTKCVSTLLLTLWMLRPRSKCWQTVCHLQSGFRPHPAAQSVTAGATNDFPLPSLDGRFQSAWPMLAWQPQVLETRPPHASLTWATLSHLSGTFFFLKSLKHSLPQAVSMHLVRVSPNSFIESTLLTVFLLPFLPIPHCPSRDRVSCSTEWSQT